MEEQNELNIGIGTEEAKTLNPEVVKIVKVEVIELGEKKSKKVVCSVKHSQQDEPISISGIKYESKGKLEEAGLWLNQDSKGLIRKGSALATFLIFVKVQTIQELVGKEVQTIQDSNGYLRFKSY